MLTLYRRHRRRCSHRREGRTYRRCQCPIWMDGILAGQEMRKSLRLRDWQKAQSLVRQWEAEGEVKQQSEPMTVKGACDEFLQDAQARGLREPTLYKYRLLFRQLRDFAAENGLRFIREVNLPMLRKFRAQWPNQNLAALKKLESLRNFFRFVHENQWTADNPARRLKNPTVRDRPTLPFTREEMTAILRACDTYPKERRCGLAYAYRLRSLVLLLRYSGLRIRDAVTLTRDQIVDGKLFLYTAKTGTPVYCPLPHAVVNALDALPGDRFFWTGESKPKSAVGDYQRSLQRLFKLAGLKDAHAHRFRDTFAVELLLAGVPLERVSVLLGHQSVKVTERHYSPWVRARQEQLEADVRRSWLTDVLVSPETKGTPEVHGKQPSVN